MASVAQNWLAVPEISTPSERMFLICVLVDTSKLLNLIGVSMESNYYATTIFLLTKKIEC